MSRAVGSAFALIAFATAVLGNPAPAPRPTVTATAVARATILSPATLRTGERARLVPSDPLIAPPRPRRAERPCDATPSAQRCPAIVFDLP